MACEIDDTPQFTQCTLTVSGVAPTITEDNDGPLREVFSKHGRLIQLHVVEGHSCVGDGKPSHQRRRAVQGVSAKQEKLTRNLSIGCRRSDSKEPWLGVGHDEFARDRRTNLSRET